MWVPPQVEICRRVLCHRWPSENPVWVECCTHAVGLNLRPRRAERRSDGPFRGTQPGSRNSTRVTRAQAHETAGFPPRARLTKLMHETPNEFRDFEPAHAHEIRFRAPTTQSRNQLRERGQAQSHETARNQLREPGQARIHETGSDRVTRNSSPLQGERVSCDVRRVRAERRTRPRSSGRLRTGATRRLRPVDRYLRGRSSSPPSQDVARPVLLPSADGPRRAGPTQFA